MSSQLLAGVGRVDITPPIGVDIMGTARRWDHAQGIHQPLTATCLVLAAGEQRLALVACDLLVIPDPTAREWRERIGAVIGAPAAQVLLGCSHTHNGPATSPHMPKIGGDQSRLRPAEEAYQTQLGFQLESAAYLAVHQLQPARLAAGVGQADLNINRRERLPDGRTVIGRNPAGPCDHDVSVLRIDSETGQPLAAVITYTTHPVISPHVNLLSPDFVGALRRVVEDLTGATALYFNGAAGNINCRKYLEPDLSVVESVGVQLGCAAAQVFLRLNPRPTEVQPTFLQSVSSLKIYPEVPVDRPAIRHFAGRARMIELTLSPPPPQDVAERLWTERQQIVAELEQKQADRAMINPAIYQELWARKLVAAWQRGSVPQTVQAELQAMRLDDVVIVAVPGEAFVEIALAIKERSPFPHTLFVGYANGAIGYIPMRADYDRGGYEVNEAFKGYGYPAVLAPGSAERIIEEALALIDALWHESESKGEACGLG
ncbi:MAG: hypothetical protein DYG89_46195 [Caldilinea sp. CFX5]|nr:hypothetical protein [Caldilinea sp. CFX5]